MTRQELINSIITYAGDDCDSTDQTQLELIEDTVDDAIEEVCNEMYPYRDGSDAATLATIQNLALNRYGYVIRRIAMFHYDKQGKEGVTTFYESGQTNSYGGGGTPAEYLASIVPIARIV